MRHILLVVLLATLVACAKEVPQDSLLETGGVAYEVDSEKLPVILQPPVKESSEFT